MQARQVKVLERLLSGDGRLTLRQLAAEANVSRKTLQRDLPFYKEWLRGYGIHLRARPRHGLEVVAGPEQREAALHALRRIRPVRPVPAGQRRLLILRDLLTSRQAAKLAYFARRFGVTESTISNDLDRVEPWLAQRGLSLDRHPGRGLCLDGPELAWRRAMVDVLREALTDEQLYSALQEMDRHPAAGNKGSQRSSAVRLLSSFIAEDVLTPVLKAVREVAREAGLRLADSALAGLVAHLGLVVTRLRQGETVRLPAAVLEELQGYKEWEWARRLADRVERATGVTLPLDEVGYITMHLKGARLRAMPDPWDLLEPDHAEALILSRQMVAQAEELLGLPLRHVPELVRGLAVHLVAAISRLRLGLEIRNPLLSQIKGEYPELFAISARACRVLGEHLRCEVPEAEVGYIAMHLGAAVERLRDTGYGTCQAVLVCATGVGSSRILASRLAQLVPEVRVTEIMTALELEERLQGPAAWPDLVISTIPIEVPGVPVVVVSPLLDAADAAAIRSVLARAREEGQRARLGSVPPGPDVPDVSSERAVDGGVHPAGGREPAGSTSATAHPATSRTPSPGASRTLDPDAPGPEQAARDRPGGGRGLVPGTAAERLAQLARRGSLLWDLVAGFILREGSIPDPVAAAVDLTRQAGACRDPARLEGDLREREALGATPVNPRLTLLHGKSRGAAKPFLGGLRDRATGRCWLVMIVPDDAPAEVRQVFSAVSVALIEHPRFSEALETGSEETVRQVLAEVLYPLAAGLP